MARVADRWLDMLDTRGDDLTDDELLEYISEATVMSKTIDEYDGRKSAAITTAKRLGEFLGDERLKDKVGSPLRMLPLLPCSLDAPRPSVFHALMVPVVSSRVSAARMSWPRSR